MTTTLYRPVGKKELERIIETGWKAFPPRLDWQPIFYPVMNAEYAAEIITAWNLTDSFSGNCGFVTAFEVNADFLKQYEVQNVGTFNHNELWIPAEQLPLLNAAIIGHIQVIQRFYGDNFDGRSDNGEALAALSASEQVAALQKAAQEGGLSELVAANFRTVFVNIGFWETLPDGAGICNEIRTVWTASSIYV